MQEVPLKLRYFERLSSKSLNKVNFNFSFERSWQGRQDYKKQTWPGASDQSFFRSQSKLIKIHLLAVYYLTKFETVFELSEKYICWFMQLTSTWFWKVRKGSKKLHKFEYLENKKSFLDETKSIFHSFWRAIIWSKNKI